MPKIDSTITDSVYLANYVSGKEKRYSYAARAFFPVLRPLVDPKQYAGSYNVLDPNNQRARLVDATWAPGSVPNVVTQSWGSGNYEIKYFRLEDNLTAADIEGARDGLDVRQAAAVSIEMGLMLTEEIAARTLVRATVAADTSGLQQAATASWLDTTNGVPRTDFLNMHKKFRDANRGIKANTAIIPEEQFITLLMHPSLRALVSGGATIANPAILTSDPQSMRALKMALGVENIFVPDVVYNAAKRGQDESTSVVWGDDDVYLTYLGEPTKRGYEGLGVNFVGAGFSLNGATPNEAGHFFKEKPFDKETEVLTIIGGIDFDQEVSNTKGVVKLTGSNAAI